MTDVYKRQPQRLLAGAGTAEERGLSCFRTRRLRAYFKTIGQQAAGSRFRLLGIKRRIILRAFQPGGPADEAERPAG